MVDEPMNGRVSIFKGEIFYSPNSSRDLILPRGTTENALRNAPPLNAREFQTPRWWAASTEWLAFIPRLPLTFSGVLLEALAHAPQKITPTAAPYGYILPENILPSWLAIEDTLDKVITSLCTLGQLQHELPSSPRQFGYSKMHGTERMALSAMVESREWFSLWIGLTYWAMCKTEAIGPGDGAENGPPRWFTELCRINFNQVLLDNLFTEPLLQTPSTTDRVGIILHFPNPNDDRSQQPPAAWFISLGIPVWYRWGAREAGAAETQPNFSLLAPPLSQLQEVTILLGPSRHPLCSKETPTQGVGQQRCRSTNPPTRDHSAKVVLNTFFRKRAAKKDKRLRRKQAKLEEGEILEDTPSTLASVFVWDWDPEDPTLFTRTHVPRNESEEILSKYASHQKRYDASCNEWDCCRLWDPEDEKTGKRGGKDSQHRSPRNQELSNLDTHAEPDGHLEQTSATHIDNITDGITEAKIFDLLRLHYGFVSPLPFPEALSISSSLDSHRNQDVLIQALGLTSIPSGSPLLQKPLFQLYTQFIRKFTTRQPQKPNDDEWDLSPSNRHTLASSSRLRNIRLVTGKSDLNFQMYMFDFGSEATVPWKLAVYSSAAALYICRMREDMREQDIVLALVQAGLPFRTFQAVNTFSEVLEVGMADSALLPILVGGNSFSLSDWHFNGAQQRFVLAQPRCGRAALCRGGFIWRIARDVVDISVALAGPSGRYANSDLYFSVLDDQGIEYMDDNLTTSELKVLTGYHLISTDPSTWRHRQIWQSGGDLSASSWWTERLERFYQKRVEVALNEESPVPRLRAPRQREQTASKRLEAWSDEFLFKQLGLPAQLE